MKCASIVLLVLLGWAQAAISQDFTPTATGFKARVNDIDIELQVFGKGIFRVIKTPAGKLLQKESLSVIKTAQPGSFTVMQRMDHASLQQDSLRVILNFHNGRISFGHANEQWLLQELPEGAALQPVRDLDRTSYRIRQGFTLTAEEAIYGLGQQQNGLLNQRGQQFRLEQENMKVAIPFFQSTKGYGIFWDNYSPTTFTDNAAGCSFDSEIGQGIDYYFLYGGHADGVIARMRELTGQAPLMPLWVFGFNQSRERYKTQYELVDVVKKYRALQVPLDGIIQDWQYWGKDPNWNAMTFDSSTFPEPKKMVDSVHQLKAHLFIVAWPGFGPQTKQYADFGQKKWLLDFETWPPKNNTRPYDVYHPAARDLYWEYMNKGLFSLDTDAWWLDCTEPDHVNKKDEDLNLPTYLGSFRSVRNAFPLQHVRGVYEHQRRSTDTKRVTILTRSAFAGQQRYSANTWSGDVVSNWPTFRKQIAAGLNFSLCGIPYWNTDIGGFFAGSYRDAGGAANPEFRELYTRWMQFACFTPMMRSHGTDIPREIYQFGQRGDRIFDVQEKFIRLRYQLLPYSYATAWQVTHHAGSFIRALPMDFAADTATHAIDNEFLYGSALLVAPVTSYGAQQQSVYLPAGSNWFDFWTGEKLAGGRTINAPTPLEQLPLYVKAGAILPWAAVVQYAEEKRWDNLEIRVYPGADGKFILYEDENNGYNYEKGLYTEIPFFWDEPKQTLTIGARKGKFNGMPAKRQFNIVVVNRGKGTGVEAATQFNKTVTYTGKAISIRLP
ncbi:MAG: glycoside hydrolase family 31 protein [Candidatus Pseudobacter hemicellulosilyticus]|uniref:Glycoside hydrolase family 31 protein n=1 Tax=Candidatus Pseudobacter hemicellulosilyticus TaxID=3121375 RepID=A0AAJ5WRR6_9BACT|nr:MAG: glycoside hydrolase family 31 protein [Pseudobacter sp.]